MLRLEIGGSTAASADAPVPQNIRQLKAEHLKKRADEALKSGNLREACQKYEEAISLSPNKETLRALHSNASLALGRCNRHAEALEAANRAVELAPTWPKAHWRRGAALSALRRGREAALAFCAAWRLDPADRECAARLGVEVRRMTREELARGMLDLVGGLEAEGLLEAARVECAAEETLREGCLSLVGSTGRESAAAAGAAYRDKFVDWLKTGLDSPEALLLRGHVHWSARSYLQAAHDAAAAREVLVGRLEERGRGGETRAIVAENKTGPVAESEGEERSSASSSSSSSSPEAALLRSIGLAHRREGEALLAEPKHPDRRPREAAVSLAKALDLLPGDVEARRLMEEAVQDLTREDLEAALQRVYDEGADGLGPLRHPGALGFVPGAARAGERVWRLDLTLHFAAGAVADLGAPLRAAIRAALARTLGVGPARVVIERVLRPGGRAGRGGAADPAAELLGLEVRAGGCAREAAEEVARRVGAGGAGQVLAGVELPDSLGGWAEGACRAEVVDVTPAIVAEGGSSFALTDSGKQLALPVRPKMELELPYKLYRLVRSDGTAPERTVKHPFCMSRVYYDAAEKPEEVWAELADGSCRWRQTGSELKIVALWVPPELSPRDLVVEFQPYSLRVANKKTGKVYLEGELERGIVPEECVWMHSGGVNEDGCVLFLQKMNLELLQRQWAHSQMWWPKLFTHHGEIAWDDYEKDYSDLPEVVLRKHRTVEAKRDEVRKLEQAEKGVRESVQERDDARKRQRQERLHFLRTGQKKDWVELHRANPH